MRFCTFASEFNMIVGQEKDSQSVRSIGNEPAFSSDRITKMRGLFSLFLLKTSIFSLGVDLSPPERRVWAWDSNPFLLVGNKSDPAIFSLF